MSSVDANDAIATRQAEQKRAHDAKLCTRGALPRQVNTLETNLDNR
jgi:hypothetical protein